MEFDRVAVETALLCFRPGNSRQERAFNVLNKYTSPYIANKISRANIPYDDGSAKANEIFLKIWNSRDKLEFEGLAAWYRYIERAIGWAISDIKRDKSLGELAECDSFESPDRADSQLTTLFNHLSRQLWTDLADEIWLGEPPDDHSIKLQVALNLLRKRIQKDEVLDYLNMRLPNKKFQTLSEAEVFLSDIWTLRKLAYDTLYFSNEMLVLHLLNEQGFNPTNLSILYRQLNNRNQVAARFKSWSWAEVVVILRRFGLGELEKDVIASMEGILNEAEIDSVNVRCAERFPFIPLMESLYASYEGHPMQSQAFCMKDLWKRLALQYRCVNNLSLSDCYNRTSPAAQRIGVFFSIDDLTMWLSGNRLADQMRRVLIKRGCEHIF